MQSIQEYKVKRVRTTKTLKIPITSFFMISTCEILFPGSIYIEKKLGVNSDFSCCVDLVKSLALLHSHFKIA